MYSPDVYLGPRKVGEPGGSDEIPLSRPLVGSLVWLSVMRERISLIRYARARATAITLVPGIGRCYCKSPRT